MVVLDFFFSLLFLTGQWEHEPNQLELSRGFVGESFVPDAKKTNASISFSKRKFRSPGSEAGGRTSGGGKGALPMGQEQRQSSGLVQ